MSSEQRRYGWAARRAARFDPTPQPGLQPATPEELRCPRCGEDALYCALGDECSEHQSSEGTT